MDRAEAEQYEKNLTKLLSYTYYEVSYDPDLTEGRKYFKEMIVGVDEKTCSNTLLHYLTIAEDASLAFCMGIAPMDNWTIWESHKFNDLEYLVDFLKRRLHKLQKVVLIDMYAKEIQNNLLEQLLGSKGKSQS